MSRKHKSANQGKDFAAKRTFNAPQGQQSHKGEMGDNKNFQQHDAAHRQGSFEGTGNHARTGNRSHQ